MKHDEKKTGEMARDLTKVIPMSKSEVKRRLEQYAEHIRKQTIEECKGIVANENYILEEWYMSSLRPDTLEPFKANQRNIKTRNIIIKALNELE